MEEEDSRSNTILLRMFWGFLYGGGGGSRLDYFTHFEPSHLKVGRKREIPEKKHLTTRKQNLACVTFDPS